MDIFERNRKDQAITRLFDIVASFDSILGEIYAILYSQRASAMIRESLILFFKKRLDYKKVDKAALEGCKPRLKRAFELEAQMRSALEEIRKTYPYPQAEDIKMMDYTGVEIGKLFVQLKEPSDYYDDLLATVAQTQSTAALPSFHPSEELTRLTSDEVRIKFERAMKSVIKMRESLAKFRKSENYWKQQNARRPYIDPVKIVQAEQYKEDCRKYIGIHSDVKEMEVRIRTEGAFNPQLHGLATDMRFKGMREARMEKGYKIIYQWDYRKKELTFECIQSPGSEDDIITGGAGKS